VKAPLAESADFPAVEQLPSHPELPDPLTMFDGSPVTTREEWFQKRRPEIQALFEYYEYGQAPPPPANVAGTVVRHVPHYFEGKATLDEVRITFGPPATPPINLLLLVPNQRRSPAPVFVALNFCGNHAVLNDPAISLPESWMPDSCKGCTRHRATDAGRGAQAGAWAIENAIDRGYAIATFYDGDSLVGAGVVRDEESLSGPNVGDLVQYRRNTKHELSKAYWNRLFDFADAYFAQRR